MRPSFRAFLRDIRCGKYACIVNSCDCATIFAFIDAASGLSGNERAFLFDELCVKECFAPGPATGGYPQPGQTAPQPGQPQLPLPQPPGTPEPGTAPQLPPPATGPTTPPSTCFQRLQAYFCTEEKKLGLKALRTLLLASTIFGMGGGDSSPTQAYVDNAIKAIDAILAFCDSQEGSTADSALRLLCTAWSWLSNAGPASAVLASAGPQGVTASGMFDSIFGPARATMNECCAAYSAAGTAGMPGPGIPGVPSVPASLPNFTDLLGRLPDIGMGMPSLYQPIR